MGSILQRVLPANTHALASVTAALVAGGFMAGLSPLYIGALIDSFGFAESEAGLVMSVELISLAATLALVSKRLVTADPFRLATIGCVLTIAAHIASVSASNLTALLCVRAGAGVAESLLTLSASMLISRTPAPDRFVAVAMVGAGLVYTLLMAGCSVAIAHYGITAMFLVAAGTCVVLLPVFVFARADTTPAPLIDSTRPVSPLMFSPPTIVLGFLAAATCLTFVGQAAWSFAERSGARVGLAPIDIGNWLAVNSFLSVVGSVVAATFATRVARMAAVTLGMTVTGLTNALFVGAGSPLVYVVPLLANGFAYGFSTPFIFGTAAKLDSRGTVVAYGNGVVMLTQALTPYIAGVVISESSYPVLAVVLGAISVVAIVLIVPSCRRVIAQTHAAIPSS
jgi:MFS family permease